MSAYAEYTHDETGVVARWHGGAYVDLGYIDGDGEFHASSTINVYDYAKGEAEISTLAELEAVVDEHLKPKCDQCEEDLDEFGDCNNEWCVVNIEDDDDEEDD